MTLFIPAVVITEFLVGHPRDLPRAHRVLSTLKELDVTPAHARRAATLLMRAAADTGRSLGAVDGIVAAFGETFGMVITNDAADLRALADAGDGFDVYDVRELRAVLGSTSP